MPNITMQQIADIAGVSLKTVSRVVNKESGVSQRTREKIEALVKEYDFQPNPSARGLASSRSYLIGLLYPQLRGLGIRRHLLGRFRQGLELL